MSNATDHLAKARDYIAKGEDYYRKAADEIISAQRQDSTLSHREIASRVGRDREWVRRLVQWRTSGEDLAGPWVGDKRSERGARNVLADPEQRRQVIASLPADVREAVIEESHEAAVADVRAKQAEQRTEPTAGQLMGSDPFDPSESWLDVHIIRVRSKAHALAHQAQKWGVVLGSMTEEEAFEAVQEAERNIAEVRVALQERLRDRDRSEV